MSDLQSFRNRIDTIDDQLIALLKERAGIVRKVGAFKQAQGTKGLFIRPGREGMMHRRIYGAFADSGLHPAAMLNIWRLLIAASTHLESPLSMAVPTFGDFAMLGREYFGNFIPCAAHETPYDALQSVANEDAAIAVLPFPTSDESWWQQDIFSDNEGIQIFAALPVVCNADSANAPAALAVGRVNTEPTGNDFSYIRMTGCADIPELENTRCIAVARNGGSNDCLLQVAEYVGSDAAIMSELQSRYPDASITILGTHAATVEAT